MRVPSIELRLLCWAASAFTSWAILWPLYFVFSQYRSFWGFFFSHTMSNSVSGSSLVSSNSMKFPTSTWRQYQIFQVETLWQGIPPASTHTEERCKASVWLSALCFWSMTMSLVLMTPYPCPQGSINLPEGNSGEQNLCFLVYYKGQMEEMRSSVGGGILLPALVSHLLGTHRHGPSCLSRCGSTYSTIWKCFNPILLFPFSFVFGSKVAQAGLETATQPRIIWSSWIMVECHYAQFMWRLRMETGLCMC